MIIFIAVIALIIALLWWKSRQTLGNSANQAQSENLNTRDGHNAGKASQQGKLTKSMYWSLSEKNHVPEYAIAWLNYSLGLGRDVNTSFYYAVQSAENGMPYLCESEEEYEWLEDYLKSQRTAVDIMLIGIRYLGEPTANNIAHPNKLEYWREQYMELVYRRGDQKARELLTRRPDGVDVSSGFFSENMWI